MGRENIKTKNERITTNNKEKSSLVKIRLRGLKNDLEASKNDLQKLGRIVNCTNLYKDSNSIFYRQYLELELFSTKNINSK